VNALPSRAIVSAVSRRNGILCSFGMDLRSEQVLIGNIGEAVLSEQIQTFLAFCLQELLFCLGIQQELFSIKY